MKITCFTSDKYLWCLKGFSYQWRKYTQGKEVEIVGFTPPPFDLGDGFSFTSLGNFSDYPANRWSDGLFKYLDAQPKSENILLLLEDYWLCREVDWDAIAFGDRWLLDNPKAVRFCATTDRLYSGNIGNYYSVGRLDIFESFDSPYQLSLQASVWNPDNLKRILVPHETPWEVEINGSHRLTSFGYKVFGTRQWPMQYQIMVDKGKLNLSGDWMRPPRQLSDSDISELRELGYLSEG